MKKTLDLLEKILEILATICLAVFCVTTFAQVFFRFILRAPLTWSEEVARFSFIYMVFLGCAVGVRRKSHYMFDIFGKSKNPTVAFLAKCAASLLCISFLSFLLYTAAIFIPQQHIRASSILRIPTSVPYFSIILFSFFGIVFEVEQLVRVVQEKKRGQGKEDNARC